MFINRPKATPEELAAASGRSRKATSAKSKAKPADKQPRSPQKPNQASPNPAPSKRMKGKQPPSEADRAAQMAEELRKVCVSAGWQVNPSWSTKALNHMSVFHPQSNSRRMYITSLSQIYGTQATMYKPLSCLGPLGH